MIFAIMCGRPSVVAHDKAMNDSVYQLLEVTVAYVWPDAATLPRKSKCDCMYVTQERISLITKIYMLIHEP